MMQPHYRCMLQSSNIHGTNDLGASELSSDVQILFPLQYANANPFWTVAGGLVGTDASITPPTFNPSSIVIRGGSMWFTLFNQELGTIEGQHGASYRCKFWYGYTSKRPGTVSPATLFPSQQPNSWDPTMLPDFAQRIGKIYYSTEVLLRVGDAFEFKRKLRTSKVDNEEFLDGGSQPFFLYQVVSLLDGGGNELYSAKSGVNMSLTGDALT